MGLQFRHSVCLYFLTCSWIGNFATARTNTRANDNLSGGSPSSYLCFFHQRPEFPRDCEEVRNQRYSKNNSDVYLIKPDGISEPFEALCDNRGHSNSGGWIIISRRLDGSLIFNRTWEEYKHGFGFFRSEFWLGNEKIAYLTNQKQYTLQIDVITAKGSSFQLSWDNFRLSDDWSEYAVSSLGDYKGPAEDVFVSCPRHMKFGICTCQATCDEPNIRNRCGKNCINGEGCSCSDGFLFKGDDCVPEAECGCFLQGRGVVKNGDTYVNEDCSSRCTCINDVLTCEYYHCSQHAHCEVRNNVRMCYCDNHFVGNGQTCTSTRGDCLDLYNAGNRNSGVYNIFPTGWSDTSFPVYCDMTTEGRGWTVFQRRKDGTTNFYRNWNSYKVGFGNENGEFWIGNDRLHAITNQKRYQLRIDLSIDEHGSRNYALYNYFRISNEANSYRLVGLGSFSGTDGYDTLDSRQNYPFSTYDNDNDLSSFNCAEKHRGGWWYGNTYLSDHCNYCNVFEVDGNCSHCTDSNLNGEFNGVKATNIFSQGLPGDQCDLKFSEMKLRPV